MKKRFLLAIAGAVALIAVSGAPAKPTADDCELAAHTFVYWGAEAEAQGSVECASAKRWIGVSAAVTRDGVLVASGEHRCSKATRCRITFAPLDDPDGDQRWCVEVSGEVSGGRTLGPRTFCEEFDTL